EPPTVVAVLVLLSAEQLEDFDRRHAAERIEALFGEHEAVPRGHHLPSAPVQRHGVGEGAVTIEDEAVDGAHGAPATLLRLLGSRNLEIALDDLARPAAELAAVVRPAPLPPVAVTARLRAEQVEERRAMT